LFNGFFEWLGSLGIFSWQALKAAVTPPHEWRELIRQLDEVGSKSLPLVALAGSAIGVVISFGSALQSQSLRREIDVSHYSGVYHAKS
jgi:ABC-type transporter Mla maintaining outer membrane lipid asymmetry permease subunit MlaE